MPAWTRSFVQGLGLGVAIVLPGLSGGTAALIMGMYDRLVRDFSRFRWRPHVMLAAGAAAGLLAGARLLEGVLASAPDLLSAFLLGVVLASAWLAYRRYPQVPASALGAWFLGIAAALAVARHPLAGGGGGAAPLGMPAAFFGGGVAGTAMMLPGMSGATLLILMGMYDDMLAALNALALPVLAAFAAGAGLGMLVIARLVSALLDRFPVPTGLFLAGMLLGSARAVVPSRLTPAAALLALAGAAIVLVWRERPDHGG